MIYDINADLGVDILGGAFDAIFSDDEEEDEEGGERSVFF
jgi:hypothetical protein